MFIQRTLTYGEGWLYSWPPVYFVWIRLICICLTSNSFTCLVKSKPVKQEVSRIVILPSPLWWVLSGSSRRTSGSSPTTYSGCFVAPWQSWPGCSSWGGGGGSYPDQSLCSGLAFPFRKMLKKYLVSFFDLRRSKMPALGSSVTRKNRQMSIKVAQKWFH